MMDIVHFLIGLVVLVLFVLIIAAIMGCLMNSGCIETECCETTTVTEQNPVGQLKRSKARNGQFFVIDPVDKDKVWLNSKDDFYEDGAGNIWKLV